MHNLALALQKQGHEVSGSDDAIFEPSKSRLSDSGLLPSEFGWFEDRIHADLDYVILGMHARADNPEIRAAQNLGLNLLSFPEFIYRSSLNKLRLAVCGSHGKTSITAMLMHILLDSSKDFDYLVGAQLDGFDIMVKLSEAPLMILEGDEYPASVLKKVPKFSFYRPQIACISGIAWDHINVFPTWEDYLDAFRGLISGFEDQGTLIYNAEDAALNELVQSSNIKNAIAYRTPEYRVNQASLEVEAGGKSYPMQVIGKHNLSNMACAVELAKALEIDEEQSWQALRSFKGAARRLERIAHQGESVMIRDFAHAPSKVRASTDAVADQFDSDRVLAVLELHTYSSLNPEFIPQYRASLNAVKEAMLYIDPEAVKLKGMTLASAEELREAFERPDLQVFFNAAELEQAIRGKFKSYPVVLMMSSGSFSNLDLDQFAEDFLAARH